MPAVARVPFEPRRVPGDDASGRHVTRYDSPGADQRHPADANTGQNHRSSPHRSSVFDDALAYVPVGVLLERTIRIHGAGVLVIEQHDARTQENPGFEVEAVEYVDAVLQLAEITDVDPPIDVRAFPQDALPADRRALADLRLVPDVGSSADLRVCGDVSGRVDVDRRVLKRQAFSCSVRRTSSVLFT